MLKGDRLRTLRKSKNLTQEELANLIGSKKSIICLYELEQRNPSLEAIIDLMHVFGVSADYLLGTECLIKTYSNKKEEVHTFTKEEVTFIEELKKHKDIYDVLIPDPKRGMEVLKRNMD